MIGNQKAETWVDVIDGGKIVRVSEEVARREGLPIIRRPSMDLKQFSAEKAQSQQMSFREKKGLLKFEEFRKPLKGDKGIVNELKDNFHWELARLRKSRGLNRRQLAESLGVSENDVKLMENGILPREDYVLINKMENFYGISLRKDSSLNGSPLQQALRSKNEARKRAEDKKNVEKAEDMLEEDIISGEDIEIDDKI